jgi:hypothetical protein
LPSGPVVTSTSAAPLSTGAPSTNQADAKAFCRDYPSVASLHGTDPATLQRAADLFRKLANEAPTSTLKADLNVGADAELAVKNGDAASVDNAAVEAALKDADRLSSNICG